MQVVHKSAPGQRESTQVSSQMRHYGQRIFRFQNLFYYSILVVLRK